MKTVLDRFLEYCSMDTTSDEESTSYPSTPNQLALGKRLAEELIQLGLSEVEQDQYGYVTATIPATAGEGGKVLGLVAHMDTSAAVSGANIKPRIVDYQGGDIPLDGAGGYVLSVEQFPQLEECVGKHLVVTDGSTLLGADDKAGVAEIVTLAQRLMAPDAPPHGKIRVAFTPDEEVGSGTKYFDVKKFGADVAYTVDGGPLGEVEYENFNAATAMVTIQGRNIHPGAAKDKMVNAAAVACEFQGLLPHNQQPAFTEGYQGFYHLVSIRGNIEGCVMKYALREHDAQKFQGQKDWLAAVAAQLNTRWGEGAVQVDIKDSYFNMRQVMESHMYLIDRACAAFRSQGVEPMIQPVRGGTDGARLSYAGLPCPNLSTGGYNFHSRFEFIPVESMETMVDVLWDLVYRFVEEK